MFSMLLGSSAPTDDEEIHHVLDGEEFCTELIRVVDKVCTAALQGHRLVVLAKTSAGVAKLSVHASRGAQGSVPLFNAAPIMECQLQAISPALECSLTPASTSLTPISPLLPLDSNILAEEFYRQLCQPDQFLLRAPLMLVGSHTGHVYCLSNAPKPALFCALNQPVVGIHLLETFADDANRSTCSAIVCIGQRGRVVLCQVGGPGQTSPRFSELQLNAPVLCTCAIPRERLLYGTPNGVYSVRLSPPPCMEQPEHSSLEVAFRFPQKVAQTVVHLLVPASTQRVIAVSLSGLVTTFSVLSAQSRSDCVAGDLRQVLRYIEATAKLTATLSERLVSLDATLVELNEALDLACDLSRPAAALPLRCKLRPTCVHTGASSLRLTLHLSLEYTRQRALKSGWSLLANMRVKSGGQRTEVISLQGLSAANAHQFCASFPILPAARGPLDLSVHCLLHYLPSTSAEGVCLSLHEETFSAVHFLLPCDSSFLQLVTTAIYSAHLRLSAGTIHGDSADVCETALLLGIVRQAGIDRSYIRRGYREAELTVKAYNGLPVTIAARLLDEDESIEITVQSCSEAIVAEISSCVSRAVKVRTATCATCSSCNVT